MSKRRECLIIRVVHKSDDIIVDIRDDIIENQHSRRTRLSKSFQEIHDRKQKHLLLTEIFHLTCEIVDVINYE